MPFDCTKREYENQPDFLGKNLYRYGYGPTDLRQEARLKDKGPQHKKGKHKKGKTHPSPGKQKRRAQPVQKAKEQTKN